MLPTCCVCVDRMNETGIDSRSMEFFGVDNWDSSALDSESN